MNVTAPQGERSLSRVLSDDLGLVASVGVEATLLIFNVAVVFFEVVFLLVLFGFLRDF